MDNIGTETDYRHYGKYSLAEVGKALDIPFEVGGIGRVALEVPLVVNEIELYAVVFILHDTNVDSLGALAVVHVEVSYVFEICSVFFGNAGVVRQDHPYVELTLVEILGESAHNISKTACFYKRNAFGSCK